MASAIGLAAVFAPAYGEGPDEPRAARGTFQPHPRLLALPDNTALDLGRYECETRVPGMNCTTLFDYSRINYDPYHHRILAFGGGHAASGRTDVDVFSLERLTWASLYPSMNCDAVREADIDPRGFHRKTGHPVARHTYDQNVIAQVAGQGRLIMFSTERFSGACHPYKATIRAVAWLPLDSENSRWQYTAERSMPWGYAGAAELDPVSGMIVLTGGQSRGIWVYDPRTNDVVASIPRTLRDANSSNLVYFPPNQRMYLFDSKTGDVRELELDRRNWAATSERELEVTGDKPGAMRNFAYDAKNRIIGGVKKGRFYAFDPLKRHWHSDPIRVMSREVESIGNVEHHAIDYDPVNNVFILVTDQRPGPRTWAYRYRR